MLEHPLDLTPDICHWIDDSGYWRREARRQTLINDFESAGIVPNPSVIYGLNLQPVAGEYCPEFRDFLARVFPPIINAQNASEAYEDGRRTANNGGRV